LAEVLVVEEILVVVVPGAVGSTWTTCISSLLPGITD